MQGVQANDGGRRQFLVRIECPRRLQLFAKAFLELLETVGNQVILAVDRILEAEIVEDSGQKIPAVRTVEGVGDFDVLPESVLRGDFVQVQVVNVQESTLFQIGKDDAPTAPQIRKSSDEQIILKCRLVFSLHRGQFGFRVAVAVVAERERQRLEYRFPERRVIERPSWRGFECPPNSRS